MKILIVNKFLYPKGGAEISMLNIAKILAQHGSEIRFFSMKNDKNIKSADEKYFVSYINFHDLKNPLQKINAFFKVLYSVEVKKKFEQLIKEFSPDILQTHNIAHQISPVIFKVAKKYNVKIVAFLHDFKVVCPAYNMLWGDGSICPGKCKNKNFYWCTIKRCSHTSIFWSLTNTIEMYLHHNILHLYDLVDIFISPSRFLKEKIEQMGFKKNTVVLPNFIFLDEFEPNYEFEDTTICYFGRLSKEKGIETLINAVKGLNVKLKIIGEGPIEESLKFKVKSEKLNNIYFLGHKSGETLKKEIRNSMAVVIPSEWFENNPRTVIETFALGKPVIGARIGGIPELVIDENTGLTFESGNPDDLREKILYLINNPDLVVQMGKNARRFVEENHNPEKYYQKLIRIYQNVIINPVK